MLAALMRGGVSPARRRCPMASSSLPSLQTLMSVAMLGGFIWAVRFLLPKAIKERDALAVTAAVLTAVFALLAASGRSPASRQRVGEVGQSRRR